MNLRLPLKDYALLCRAVLIRDKYRCRNCNFRQNLSVHHIVFRSQGGPDASWNLITICNACHNGIHVDVKDGVFGLTISPNEEGQVNADKPVHFIRAEWWFPK